MPVLPTGLDASGLNVLQTAKNDGVRIDVVNVMAMDYGEAVDNNGQMGQDAISAAVATERGSWPTSAWSPRSASRR